MDEIELRIELTNLINDYLVLTKEDQFKYVEHIIIVIRHHSENIKELKNELNAFLKVYLEFPEEEQIKNLYDIFLLISYVEEYIFISVQRKILESFGDIISRKIKAQNTDSEFDNICFWYSHCLYDYLNKIEDVDANIAFFEEDSPFLTILNWVIEIPSTEKNVIVSSVFSVFYMALIEGKVSRETKIFLIQKLKSIIDFIIKTYNFEAIDYWYFSLDKKISIFQMEHLGTINDLYIENPRADYVEEYLDFLARHFNEVIESSEEVIESCIKVISSIEKKNDSDIIRDQVIQLLERFDNDTLDEEGDSSFILSSDTDKLLNQADDIIYDIRSKLKVDVKDFQTIASFGHYTKIDTLTSFLIRADWKDDNENDSKVKSPFLRLTHLKQLNDPMEGRAIYDYLGMDNTFFHNYQTSNVFISSLTVVSDSLPMWKEYADSSQGAFLEYDKTYLEGIVAHKYIEFVKIHYLDLNSDKKEESDVDKSLSRLKQIFEKLQDLKAEKELISFAEKLKKISYLFKVKDYEYEMEYRILINLDDTAIQKIINRDGNDLSNENFLKKEEIGLEIFDKVNYNDYRKHIVLSPKDNGRYDLFVYINLAPLKYSKVILGPKVTDADYIAPYLKLANPEIEIESSKIPYR
ncbi:DUF2971 domain-containing protein [Streptococcus shenyangsis]|uniref:DUF2971 domain-containing protein n=2 Tax=Streptococcus TaxID=1301 RepID=A0ABY2YCI1_9STRE|nr:DUF2971 domain-containing protein [Streptococcus sp. D2]TPE37424.1 DUF2971 domain-containing protein [Streptococcus shenyangsis]